MPPLIGITANVSASKGVRSIVARENYSESVRKAGGIPVWIPPLVDASLAPSACAKLDGLLFSGGGDIRGERFGHTQHPEAKLMASERESWDFALLTEALANHSLPIFCICLGIQELNVALGGTLHQHVPGLPGMLEHRRLDARPERFHPAEIDPDSRLHGILETSRLEVNTRHHQAIDQLGRGLRTVARAPDGTIEAVESADEHAVRFLLGLQWHPECISDRPEQARLFKAFVAAATAK